MSRRVNWGAIKRYLKDNIIVRCLSYPYLEWRQLINRRTYIKECRGDEIKRYKNIHQGERCFIVANGPSLTKEDLEKLNSEICFGMNRIYDLFDEVKWRPTYYMCYDLDVIKQNIDEIFDLKLEHIFLDYRKVPHKYKKREKSNIHYFFVDYVFSEIRGKRNTRSVSKELEQQFSQVCSVTQCCIEFAIYMGFKEIYILGCDNTYSVKKNNYASGIKQHNYVYSMSEKKLMREREYSNGVYRMYKKYADKSNIVICNVTRGGNLEEFERKNLNEVLGLNYKDEL